MKALAYLQNNRSLHTAVVLHISLRKFQTPSTFRLGEITVGVNNSLTTLNCRYGQKTP